MQKPRPATAVRGEASIRGVNPHGGMPVGPRPETSHPLDLRPHLPSHADPPSATGPTAARYIRSPWQP